MALKPRAQSIWPRLLAAFAAGLLLAAAFPEMNLSIAAWIAPGLMLWICATRSSTLRLAYIAGLGRWMGSIYWLLFIPFRLDAIAGFIGLAAILASLNALWCWICLSVLPGDSFRERWNSATPFKRALWPIFCAAAWVAVEMITARLLTGFPWNILGASQYAVLPLIQIASWTGVYGISFLVVWTSMSIVAATIHARTFRGIATTLSLPCIAVLGAIVYGESILQTPEPKSATVKIALVQPSIPQPAIWDPNEKTNRFLKLVDLSRNALQQSPDILVWPEAAMPDIFTRNKFTQQSIAHLVASNKVWMVIGASDSRPRPGGAPGELEWANSAFLIAPGGDLANRYNKKHLVMFGEYMPLANRFPFLAKFRASGAGLTAGNKNVLFTTSHPTAHFPVVICYEDMFPHEVRERVSTNTDFIVNLTNDGWFGHSAVQWQHAINALFRAVENGIPLVRCTNNGLTCWIDSHGKLHEVYFAGSKDIRQPGWKIAEVPLRPKNQKPTFYTNYGDVFGWSCVIATLLAFAKVRSCGFSQPRSNPRTTSTQLNPA